MRIRIRDHKSITPLLIIAVLLLSVQGAAYAQPLTASSASPLTEATLDESIVTLTLEGHTWERFRITIGNALDVSGIPGVKISTFGPAWFGVKRISDTEITAELGFEGDFDTDSILTFTVGADAIVDYNGTALTAQIPVTVSIEQDPPADDPEETEPPPTYDYIQGPWLWMIAEGSDIDTDYLSTLSNGEVSEVLISMNGVKSGDLLGDLPWTPEVIPSSIHCETEWVFIVPVHRCKSNNVQHVVNATGLSAVQDLNHYTAYAFMNIISDRKSVV